MKNILFLETWNCTPHIETALEVAASHLESNDNVSFYFAGHDVLFKEGLSVGLEDCGKFREPPEVLGIKRLAHKNLHFFPRCSLPEFDTNHINDFESLTQLLQFRIGNFEAGLAVASSLVSLTQNSATDVLKQAPQIRLMLESCMRMYLFAKDVIKSEAPDIVYVFNGRFCHQRALMRAAEESGAQVLFHERGANKYHYSIEPFMSHDCIKLQEDVTRTWDEAKRQADSFEVARNFYIERRLGSEQSWVSFTDQQKKDLLPDLIPGKRVVTYFSTCDDEFVAVGDIFKWQYWTDQFDAVSDLIEICRTMDDVQLIIRLHPHLKFKSVEDQARWLSLASDANLTVVSFDSPIDTYALIERSDIVVTSGSTVGIEAVYWGTPSIGLGPSFYSELNVVYRPSGKVELKALLDRDNLVVDPTLALSYGYYQMSFGRKFRYYEPETLFTGRFLGINLQAVPRNRTRWLRFKHVLDHVKSLFLLKNASK